MYENEIISMSLAWDKEKIYQVPDRNRTYDLPNTGRALYPLELRKTSGERGHILGSVDTCPAYCYDQQCRCRNVF